jgi:hypothetical protein
LRGVVSDRAVFQGDVYQWNLHGDSSIF